MRRRLLLALALLALPVVATSAGAGTKSSSVPGQILPLSSDLPTIIGTPTVGKVLTTSSGTWEGPKTSYVYQWDRCNSSGAACSAILTATTQNYIPAATDVGSTLRVVVAATNKNGSAVATSPATATVTAPSISTTSSSSTTAGSSTTSETTTTVSSPTTTTASTSTTATPTGDTTPPSQPTGLAVSAATGTSVSLAWSPSTDDVGVAGYGVYLNGAGPSTASQPSTTVSNLTCGTSYTFEVDAYDVAGNHSTRAAVTASTSACADTQPPTTPTNVSVSSRTATSIALSWSPSADNVGVVGYGLYRDGTLVGTSAGITGIFSGLVCNRNYTLAVDAYDGANNRSAKVTVMVATTACPDTSPPSVPTGLAASSVTQTSLTLTWSASSDDVGVTGYDVYRNGTKMTSGSATSSSQTDLACGTSYSFAVAAHDAAGNASSKATLNASTSACPPPGGCQIDAATMTAPGCTLKRDDTAAQADSVTGLWGSIDCASPTRVQYLTTGGDPGLQADGSSQGNAAFRQLTVQDGDNIYGERCEIGRNEMRYGENQPGQTTGTFALYPEGSHRITFFSERYGAGFTSALPNWQTVMQFKQAQPYAANGPVDGAPALELQIYAGRLRLHSFWNEIWTTAAPPNGVWIRYALDVTYSQDPAKGKVQVFVDLDGDGDFVDPGEASPVFSMRTLAYVTSQGSGTIPVGGSLPDHLRLGIYHDPSAYSNTTVDVDNVQVVSG